MLNTCMLWKPDYKNPGIPGQDIYHYATDKSIKNRYNVEKDDFLVTTTYKRHKKRIYIMTGQKGMELSVI